MNILSNKRILLVIPFNYYLFGFYPALLERLQNSGFQVTVFTIDKTVINSYKTRGISIKNFSNFMKFFYKVSSYSLVRPFSWCVFYTWSYMNKNKFDLAIVPMDNKLIFYSLIKFMKSLSIHCTANFVDLDIELKEHKSDKKHYFLNILEKITGLALMPRFMGQVTSHNINWYIDKMMGVKSRNLQQGFSNIDLLSVTGHKIKDNFIKAGLDDLKPRIHVVGNPSYEGFLDYCQKFTEKDILRFKRTLGVCEGNNLFTLFLSPSSFTKVQIKEIVSVIKEVNTYEEKSFICIKSHPKAQEKYINEISKLALGITENVKIIREFKGDQFNLDLILSSKATIQKQSGVGFISMIVKKPIISYNLFDTYYWDDLYKTLGCSFHSESIEELKNNLKKLDNPEEIQKLEALQLEACENFCLSINNPSEKITKVISGFLKTQEK